MPIVAIAPSNDLLSKLHSNIQEVCARGGQVFIFTDKETAFVNDNNHNLMTIIPILHVSDLLAPFIYTIPLQLLAYHVGVLKGTDVDQPRNLAKSVTVE